MRYAIQFPDGRLVQVVQPGGNHVRTFASESDARRVIAKNVRVQTLHRPAWLAAIVVQVRA